ncbi:glycerate kinase [Actinomycetota bacterium]|nr:glycerate kinase [Actinomycetota bacterium]
MTPPGRPLRVLLCPDKFKGTLTATEVAALIAEGLDDSPGGRERFVVRSVPVADGGEGTVDAVIAEGGRTSRSSAPGADGLPVEATWALQGERAVVEVAATCGLRDVEPTPRSALDSRTDGTGVLMRAALDAGVHELLVGIGGTASTDGGTGALRGLGCVFLDEAGSPVVGGGRDLVRIRHVDVSGLDPRLAGVRVVLGCDVSIPLCGPGGAAQVFAPQKGADAAAVQLLADGLENLADVLVADLGVDVRSLAWGGAGGGIGAGLHAVLGARFVSGIELVADVVGLDGHLADADVVVVGEGSLDEQSFLGKAVSGVARRAAAHGVRVVAVAGQVTLPPEVLAANGIEHAVSVARLAGSPQAAMADPRRWVRAAGRELGGWLAAKGLA